MNKKQTDQYVAYFVGGLLYQYLFVEKSIPHDPLVYDESFSEELRGRKMSDEDREKVEEALWEFVDSLFTKSGGKSRRRGGKVKGIGKPGRKWKGYERHRITFRCGRYLGQ